MPHDRKPRHAGPLALLMLAALPGIAAAAVADDFALEQRALEAVLRPAAPGNAPAPPGRYAYIVSTHLVMKVRVVQFVAWLDAQGCALPLAANHEPLGVAAHAVRGRLERGSREVRIEAHVTAASGAPAGRAAAEVRGADAAAITRAAREVMRRLKLVCGG